MSYSGELAYEIHVPADKGRAMWNAVLAAGAEYGLMPYGTEAMGTLRIEKGHIVVGAEADGRTTADDLGLGRAREPREAVHWRTAAVAAGAHRQPDRWQLVGLVTLDDAPMPRACEDRRRSRSSAPAADAGARHVVVPEP
jgi:sarcosine oxidase subunit alpha